jgi:hypothetical protein
VGTLMKVREKVRFVRRAVRRALCGSSRLGVSLRVWMCLFAFGCVSSRLGASLRVVLTILAILGNFRVYKRK